MLKKYKVTYSATVEIEYKRILRKNILEEYNIPKEYTEFFYDDKELTKDIINNIVNKDACYVVRFLLPMEFLGSYDYSSAKVKEITLLSVLEYEPTIEELMKHGTIEDLREILVEKP